MIASYNSSIILYVAVGCLAMCNKLLLEEIDIYRLG